MQVGDVAARFGEAVRDRREQKGLKQRELAEAVALELGKREHEFHVTTLAKIERGTRPTPLDEAAAVARVLGVPLERLLIPPDESQELLRVAEAEHHGYMREIAELQSKAAEIATRLQVAIRHEERARQRLDALTKQAATKTKGGSRGKHQETS